MFADIEPRKKIVLDKVSVFCFVGKRHNLDVLDGRVVNCEAYERALHLPTLKTCRTGIDVEKAEMWIAQNLENMAMTRDEELRRAVVDLLLDAAVVLTRVSADVLHQDVDAFATETQYLGKHPSQVAPVAVAADSLHDASARGSPKRLLQARNEFGGTNVAGMPDFVALLEIL